MLNYYCSCGAVLRGNGALASHRRAHEKRNEMRHQGAGGDIHSLNCDQWVAMVASEIRALKCEICGAAAACIGRYEDMKRDAPACDECCGHACEDGHCTSLTDDDGDGNITSAALVRAAAWLTARAKAGL